jgi:hypothetical protein
MLITLRDRAEINDTTLWTAQTRFDREARRLSQPDVL